MQNYFQKATVQVRYFFKSVDSSDLSSSCTLHCVRGTLQDPCRLCAFPPPNWRSGRGQDSHPRWPLRPRQPRSQSGWAAVHLRWPLSARWPRCLDLKRLDWCPSSLAAQCSMASISKRLDRSPSSVAAQCSMASISKRSDRSPSSVVAQDAMASISLWGGISVSSTLEIQASNWAKMASILPCSVSVVWLPSNAVNAGRCHSSLNQSSSLLSLPFSFFVIGSGASGLAGHPSRELCWMAPASPHLSQSAAILSTTCLSLFELWTKIVSNIFA